MDESGILINLASKEYSKCIEKYLRPEDRYITCIFGEPEGGRVVQKGVYAKMARGEMVRFMAGIHAEEPEQIKAFDWNGYHFDEDRSSDTEYVFIQTEYTGEVISEVNRFERSVYKNRSARSAAGGSHKGDR